MKKQKQSKKAKVVLTEEDLNQAIDYIYVTALSFELLMNKCKVVNNKEIRKACGDVLNKFNDLYLLIGSKYGP